MATELGNFFIYFGLLIFVLVIAIFLISRLQKNKNGPKNGDDFEILDY